MEFVQKDFEHRDLYSENTFLKDLVDFYVSSAQNEKIKNSLISFSKVANSEIRLDSVLAEEHPPVLKKYDHWGGEVNEIKTHEAWSRLHKAAATHELVALGYNKENKEFSRFHQFLKILIFHPSSAFYSCPLAMTDGAAKVLKKYLKNSFVKDVFDHLTSSDPENFWTAGQWMTEKPGGSDVSNSETIAKHENGVYLLNGIKWFTSAITSEVAMALAKIEGSESLSLFLIKIRDEKGNLNKIELLRLKDKLGTRAMPTAELRLNGCEGFLIGGEGRGVKEITEILNISRLYNSVCASGSIFKLLSLAVDYSNKRFAFGKRIAEHPLHRKTLLEQRAKVRACIHLVSYLSVLLGRQEHDTSVSETDLMLRFLTPIAKLWTAKKSIEVTSELLECFGGAGYIEDTGLPKFLRDAQVFSIWEGTTNILSLDVLRALTKDEGRDVLIKAFDKMFKTAVKGFENEKEKLAAVFEVLKTWLTTHINNREQLELGCREFSMKTAEVLCGFKMIEFAEQTKNVDDELDARTFIKTIQNPNF